jgi:hypothetical protein
MTQLMLVGAIAYGSNAQGTSSMWLTRKKPAEEGDATEKLRYSRYYEHDGALRAYANRAMMLAFLCIPITMLALSFAYLSAFSLQRLSAWTKTGRQRSWA